MPTEAELRGHEPSDANTKGVAIFAASFVTALCLILLGLTGVSSALKLHNGIATPKPMPARMTEPRGVPPWPLLQRDPPKDLREYLSRENQRLSSYGWVDAQKGIAWIPIDRAMELLATQARDTGEEPPGASRGASTRALQGTSDE